MTKTGERKGMSKVTGKGMSQSVLDQCPLCGRSDWRDMGKPRVGAPVRKTSLNKTAHKVHINGYKNCGYYYCSPRVEFSQENLAILYNNEYFELSKPTGWYQKCAQITVPTRNLERLERLCTRHVHDFLEIGCGEGYVLESALRKGWQEVGVEISPAFAESVSKRLGRASALAAYAFCSLKPGSESLTCRLAPEPMISGSSNLPPGVNLL